MDFTELEATEEELFPVNTFQDWIYQHTLDAQADWQPLSDPGWKQQLPIDAQPLMNPDVSSYCSPYGPVPQQDFVSDPSIGEGFEPQGYSTVNPKEITLCNLTYPEPFGFYPSQTQTSQASVSNQLPTLSSLSIQSTEPPSSTLSGAYESPAPPSVARSEAVIPSPLEAPSFMPEANPINKTARKSKARPRGRPRASDLSTNPLTRSAVTKKKQVCTTSRVRRKRSDESQPHCENCLKSKNSCSEDSSSKLFKSKSNPHPSPAGYSLPASAIVPTSHRYMFSNQTSYPVKAPQHSDDQSSGMTQNTPILDFGTAIPFVPLQNPGPDDFHVRYIIKKWPNGKIASHNLHSDPLRLSGTMPPAPTGSEDWMARLYHQLHCVGIAARDTNSSQFCFVALQIPGEDGQHWKMIVMIVPKDSQSLGGRSYGGYVNRAASFENSD